MATGAKNFGRIRTVDELEKLAHKLLLDDKPVGFDVETGYHGPDREKGAVFIDWDQQFVSGFSITNNVGWARYVPVAHDLGDNLPEREAWEIIKPVLESVPIVAHNMKFEMRNLRALERKERGPRIDINVLSDSMIESFVLSEQPSFGLKDLVRREFGYVQSSIDALFPGATGKQLKALRFNVLDLTSDVVAYACEDAVWTLALHQKNHQRVKAQRSFMYQLEMGIMECLADMEDAGLHVDWEALKQHRGMSESFLARMEASARHGLGEMAGRDLTTLNLGSTKQMGELLYDELGLRTTRTTKSGAMSTDAIALEGLARENPAIKKTLEVREVKNLANRLDKWCEEYSVAHDGRVHPNFAQTVVETGRFAAGDPAVQQLPKEWRWATVLGVDVWKQDKQTGEQPDWDPIKEFGANGKEYWNGNFRDFIVAGPGCYQLGFDYSQIELRVLAGVSQEPALLEAFNEERDVHTLTAAMMLGKSPEDITDKERAIGKTQNFALLYGMGAQSLSERLAIDIEKAKALYAQYFAAFTLVTTWMEKARREGVRSGFVQTYFNRKCTLWELQNSNKAVYSKGERKCVNAPIQGGAADYMKIAMLRARKALKQRGWWMTKVWLTNNLHDALTFEVDNSIHPEEVRELLSEAVVFEVKGFPKIKADWELGQQWGSGTKWTDEPVEFDGECWRVVKDGGEGREEPPEPDEGPLEDVAEGSDPEPVEEPPEPAERRAEVVPIRGESVIVEISEMPSQRAFARFMELIGQHPGRNTVSLRTPEGELEVPHGTSLDTGDQGRISMVLGGARVYRPADSVDVSALSRGLAL